MSNSKKGKIKRNARRKNRSSSLDTSDFSFVKCPVAGLIHFKTKKFKNGIYMFDSIDFFATDINHESFEMKGLRFDENGGWYDPNAKITKYYGKNVFEACMEYAVDRAINDCLYLSLAIFGQKRPAKFAMTISHDEIVEMMKKKTDCPVVLVDKENHMKIA